MTLFAVSDNSGNPADPLLDQNIAAIMPVAPAIREVWIYAHGWQTSFPQACSRYNEFGSGFLPYIGRSSTRLSIAVHWPSTLSDTIGPAGVFDVLTFYQMEKLADEVGIHTVAPIIASLVRHQTAPLTINLVGHSFGAKVVLSALQQIAVQAIDTNQVVFNAALLQPAIENDALEPNGEYWNLRGLQLRILASRSDYDNALKTWFALAGALAGRKDRLAMGYAGPTINSKVTFGSRLQVLDLSAAQHKDVAKFGAFEGSHDDVAIPAVYSALAEFTGQTGPATPVSGQPNPYIGALRIAA